MPYCFAPEERLVKTGICRDCNVALTTRAPLEKRGEEAEKSAEALRRSSSGGVNKETTAQRAESTPARVSARVHSVGCWHVWPAVRTTLGLPLAFVSAVGKMRCARFRRSPGASFATGVCVLCLGAQDGRAKGRDSAKSQSVRGSSGRRRRV